MAVSVVTLLVDPEQSERREPGDQFDREMLRVVPLPHVRADFRVRELADGAPEQLLLLGQAEIHRMKNDIMSL